MSLAREIQVEETRQKILEELRTTLAVVQVPLAQGSTEKAQLTRIGELEGNVVTVRAHVATLHGYAANLTEQVASIKGELRDAAISEKKALAERSKALDDIIRISHDDSASVMASAKTVAEAAAAAAAKDATDAKAAADVTAKFAAEDDSEDSVEDSDYEPGKGKVDRVAAKRRHTGIPALPNCSKKSKGNSAGATTARRDKPPRQTDGCGSSGGAGDDDDPNDGLVAPSLVAIGRAPTKCAPSTGEKITGAETRRGSGRDGASRGAGGRGAGGRSSATGETCQPANQPARRKPGGALQAWQLSSADAKALTLARKNAAAKRKRAEAKAAASCPSPSRSPGYVIGAAELGASRGGQNDSEKEEDEEKKEEGADRQTLVVALAALPLWKEGGDFQVASITAALNTSGYRHKTTTPQTVSGILSRDCVKDDGVFSRPRLGFYTLKDLVGNPKQKDL
uniref:Uncharacterized protein n=1 Tax=Mantoniella antarctica TaxID=81844 RepID=A0A7S0SLW1_9CHLO